MYALARGCTQGLNSNSLSASNILSNLSMQQTPWSARSKVPPSTEGMEVIIYMYSHIQPGTERQTQTASVTSPVIGSFV